MPNKTKFLKLPNLFNSKNTIMKQLSRFATKLKNGQKMYRKFCKSLFLHFFTNTV